MQFYEKMGIEYFKEDIFQIFDVSSRQGYEFLCNDSSSKRRHNDASEEETHGRKSVINLEKIHKMERILETGIYMGAVRIRGKT